MHQTLNSGILTDNGVQLLRFPDDERRLIREKKKVATQRNGEREMWLMGWRKKSEISWMREESRAYVIIFK